MAKLFKGEYVRLDDTGYVYNNVASAPKSIPVVAVVQISDTKVEEAEQRAREIVAEAEGYKQSAQEQMYQEAQEALEKGRSEGYMRGYEEGHAQGFLQGHAQAIAENEQTLARIVSLLQEIDKGKQAIYEKHQQDMLDLALDIARKVIGNQLSKNDKAFLNIFKKAAEGLYGQKNIRLLISPHEAKVVTTLGDELRGMISGMERMDVQVLEDAPQGTCILETEDTLIDASAQKQVDKLAQAIEAVK